MRSARSKTVTAWPARVSCCAAARPAGPEPTTATFCPVLDDGMTGAIASPASVAAAKPCSTMLTSTCLIVTGSSLIPSTQLASHGAGQRRPVNSGKLFVACRRSSASDQSPRYTRSFHSGMRFPSGQPTWQNGMPQSMHRAAWVRRWSAGNGSYTSRQSRRRTGTERRAGSSRPYFMNPVGSPTGRRHDRLVHVDAPLLRDPRRLQHPLEVLRHDLLEPLQLVVPVAEDARRDLGSGLGLVPPDRRAQELDVVL